MSAMLRLCSPSKPMKAKATMVSATITSMSVNPPAAGALWGTHITAGPAADAPRSGAARSPVRTEVEVARRNIGVPGESVGDVQRIDLLAIVEVDHRRVHITVGVEVGEGNAFVKL